MRRRLREALRRLGRPLLGHLDGRFQAVSDQLDDRMEKLYGRVATDVETMSELTLSMQRSVDVSRRQVEDFLSGLGDAPAARARDATDLAMPAGDASSVEELFAIVAAGRLPLGARILHVGPSVGDTTLPVLLASLGYEVTTVDRSTSSNDHPNVAVVSGPVDSWSGPTIPFDCVVWLAPTLSENVLDLSRKWLKGEGDLVVSVRLEPESGDRDVDRRATAVLDEWLHDWAVLDRRLLVLQPPATWVAVNRPLPLPPAVAASAIALVRATPRS